MMVLQLSQFFPLCLPPPSTPQSLRQSPYYCSRPWPCIYILWLLHFLYCTLHPHGYSNYLFVLLSPLTSSLIPPSSGNNGNLLCIHDSVSILFVCLVCFLESVVDRYVFPFYSYFGYFLK